MKTKTKLTILFLIIAAALLAVDYLVLRAEDDTEPVISFPSTQTLYSDGMDDETLLEGVTAEDDKDGDVSDSLRIGEKITSDDGSYITIFYIARDSSNNIAQSSRIMEFAAAANAQTQQEAGPVQEDSGNTGGTEGETQTSQSGNTGQSTDTGGEEANADELGRQDNEEAIAALSADAPRIYLSQYAVDIAQGSDFEPLSYVEDIQDDADARDDLYLGIQIYGTVNTSTAGTYELYYYVIDSEGNQSNEAKLTVTVS